MVLKEIVKKHETDENVSNFAEKPMISVIVAVFNGAKTLQRCIDTAARQTYVNKELIIADGGSSDGTVDIIRKNTVVIAHWASGPDRGICHAWNKSLSHAKGNWMYFLGADDFFWEDNVLEEIAPHLASKFSETRVVYGRVNTVRSDGTVIKTYGEEWPRIRRRFLQVMCIPHQGVFHHRSLFDTHGPFDESFKIGGDYELLLRELKTKSAQFVNVVVAGMAWGGASSRPLLSMHALREVDRARRKNGVHVVPILWLWDFMKAWVKHVLSLRLGEDRAREMVDLYRRLTRRPPLSDSIKGK
jgi:glycosyltransferase involved in cell wall biosynthesis